MWLEQTDLSFGQKGDKKVAASEKSDKSHSLISRQKSEAWKILHNFWFIARLQLQLQFSICQSQNKSQVSLSHKSDRRPITHEEKQKRIRVHENHEFCAAQESACVKFYFFLNSAINFRKLKCGCPLTNWQTWGQLKTFLSDKAD